MASHKDVGESQNAQTKCLRRSGFPKIGLDNAVNTRTIITLTCFPFRNLIGLRGLTIACRTPTGAVDPYFFKDFFCFFFCASCSRRKSNSCCRARIFRLFFLLILYVRLSSKHQKSPFPEAAQHIHRAILPSSSGTSEGQIQTHHIFLTVSPIHRQMLCEFCALQCHELTTVPVVGH